MNLNLNLNEQITCLSSNDSFYIRASKGTRVIGRFYFNMTKEAAMEAFRNSYILEEV